MELAMALLIGSLGLGLEVEAPQGCLTADQLEALVEEEIGPSLVNVWIVIAAHGDRWRAQVESAAGVRIIDERGDDCRALDRALVLMIALLAETPLEVITPAPDAPLEQQPRSRPYPSAMPEIVRVLRTEEEPWPVSLRFGVDAAMSVGALPEPALGGRVSGAIGVPVAPIALWIETGFTAWRPHTLVVDNSDLLLRESTHRFDADLQLCALGPLDLGFEIGVCAGARVGRISLGGEIDRGTGAYEADADDDGAILPRGGEDARVLLAITAELRAAWRPLEGLIALVAVGGSLDLLDNTLYLPNVPELYGPRSSPVWGVFRAGAHWEL